MVAIDRLLKARFASIILLGALSTVTTGLAGRSLRQLHNNTTFVKNLGETYGLHDARLHAGDIVAAIACTCTAAGCGVIVATYSEFMLHRERKKGYAPWGSRLIQEVLIILTALFMLGSVIATTVIVQRHARITGVPDAIQALAMKMYNKSTAYRDYMSFPTMILAWITFGALVLVASLVIAAGLHYRKAAREQHHEVREEKHNGRHLEGEA